MNEIDQFCLLCKKRSYIKIYDEVCIVENIFEKFRKLCGNKELIIRYRYTRDGGHGDVVNEIFIMLTYDGEHPYYINSSGKFNIYGDGFKVRNTRYTSNKLPSKSAARRLERTTWKISPSLI